MIFVVCILGLLGATMALFQSGVCIMACCVLGSACGVWLLYAQIAGKLHVKLTSLMASSLLIGYCGGPTYSEVMALMADKPLLTYVRLDANWMAYALMLVMMACVTLLVAGTQESPLIGERQIVEMSWKQERFLWICAALIGIAYFRGTLSYMSNLAGSGGRVSVFGLIVLLLAGLAPAIGAIGFTQSTGWRRIRFGAAGLICLLANIPIGRRVFAYALLLALIGAFRLSGRTLQISRGRKAVMSVAAVGLVLVASFILMALRMASNRTGERHLSISKITQVAERTSLTDPRAVFDTLSSNVDTRTSFLIQYLALLSKGGHSASPLYGTDAELGVLQLVPSVFYDYVGVDKTRIRMVSEEDLANEHFGLITQDMANSVLTGGFIDFGLLGVLVYPVLACVLARGFLLLLAMATPREGQVLAILAIISLFLATELAIQGYLIDFRNTVVLVVVWALLYSLPSLTRKWEHQPVFSR